MESYPAQPAFHPSRGAPCFCGSDRLFRDCCGSFAETRNPPHGVRIVRGYVNRATCQRWVEYLERQPRQRLMVVDTKRSTTNRIVQVPDQHRITEEVQSRKLRSQIGALARRAFTTVVSRTCKRRFAWLEEPVVLRYQAGGQYGIHADSDFFDADRDTWFKCMDRDMSLLIYLNEQFTGGEIRFVNFNFAHRPATGDLVFFPSDHRYMHEAQTVHSGVRYAIVSWAAFRARKRIMNAPQGSRIMLN
jgi:predicted 2-oxoglutarate/Fe(II)-dependent dioxygenase YbiX